MRPHNIIISLSAVLGLSAFASLVNGFGFSKNSFASKFWKHGAEHSLQLLNNQSPEYSCARKNYRGAYTTTITSRMVALVAEPDGGEELIPIKAVEVGARMKNMGVSDEAKGKDGPAYNFWMTANVSGKVIAELRAQISKEASKKANFPGFRKGQIPPYAQPKMTAFALQEGIVKTAENVVACFGVKALDGSAGDMQVKEDMQEVLKKYKLGDDLSFTATLKCEFDPAAKKADLAQGTTSEDNNDPKSEAVVVE